MEQNFNIIIPSNRLEMAKETQKCLSEFDSKIFSGSNYPSFSKLINDCILSADKEIIIIANDKVRPESFHIKKILFLLNKGFGLVGLYHFGFFGFTKNLIRKIGFFDERFIGGGQEDRDFGRRLIEHDIAVYLSHETPYVTMKSSWRGDLAESFYNKKWFEDGTRIRRLLEEEIYDYDLGPINGESHWMSFNDSMMIKTSLPSHKKLQFFNDKLVNFSQMKCSEVF